MTQAFNIPNTAPYATAQPGTVCVMMCQAKSGAWIVRDAADRRGGVFATSKAARRFIDGEFGAAALIIDPALPGATAPLKRRLDPARYVLLSTHPAGCG